MGDCTDEKMEKFKEKLSKLLFELITDIPESLYTPSEDSDEKIKKIIRQASLKAATVSATLSVPAGVTGVLTSIPDIAAIWRIQAQLVSDIAATYGKFAQLSREAMVWCLFRHSAASSSVIVFKFITFPLFWQSLFLFSANNPCIVLPGCVRI